MPIPLLAAAPFVAKGIGKIFDFFGHKKQAKEQKAAMERQRQATVAGLNIKNNMNEDTRLARLNLAQSLLGSVPLGPRGENRGTALDPALVNQLGIRRKYDFDKAVAVGADPGAGAGTAFLGGLLGDAGDALANYNADHPKPKMSGPMSVTPTMGYDPNKNYDLNGGSGVDGVTEDDLYGYGK